MVIVLKKLALAVFSAGVGIFAGTGIATPPIALMNYLANDGPLFPPPMVAFGLLALPIGFLLFWVQASLVAYELISQRLVLGALLPLATVSGAAAGVLWHLALDPSSPNLLSWLALALCGVLQSLAVFSSHWIANKLRFAAPRLRSQPSIHPSS